MTENFVAYQFFIDYSLNIGYNQWLMSNQLITDWLLIDFIDVINVID